MGRDDLTGRALESARAANDGAHQFAGREKRVPQARIETDALQQDLILHSPNALDHLASTMA